MRSTVLLFLGLALSVRGGPSERFLPAHRVSGVGLARIDISDELLQARTVTMMQTQTFGILREPQALPAARRLTSDAALQSLFRSAAARSGLPPSLLEAIAYLESWGDAKAESPAGPKGIMQISEATAHDMGLAVKHATRYRKVREQVEVTTKRGKPKFKTVTHKVPYSVTVRDDRLVPARAIPAAAVYLAGMERKFGGRDWAIFAYHCGQGCVTQMLDLTRRARGIPGDRVTVARMFFSCSPAWNRELYAAIEQQMRRDWSPTYWFRIMRAQQLLALYREDPAEFASLTREYRSDFNSTRAPHRLSVWLRRADLVFHSGDDLRSDLGRKLLAKAFDRPGYFGYSLNVLADSSDHLDLYSEASPAAIGALAYIAFETRRLYEEVDLASAEFRPLQVVSLVEPEEFARGLTEPEALAHCSGQVFDIDYSNMPPGELECLRFVLNDLGWDGYLGFVDEGRSSLHIGSSPSAREFFTAVYEEAAGKSAAE
jgi:hypothetical protein